jgi:hypothetical protein
LLVDTKDIAFLDRIAHNTCMKKTHSPKVLPSNVKDLLQLVIQHSKNHLSVFKIAAILLLQNLPFITG